MTLTGNDANLHISIIEYISYIPGEGLEIIRTENTKHLIGYRLRILA